jgi:hypothetical protein
MNDLLIEIEVTAPDGASVQSYFITVLCDEPSPLFLGQAILRATDVASLVTYIPANNAYRVWPAGLGTFTFDVNVTGTTSSACASTLSYYHNGAEDYFHSLSGPSTIYPLGTVSPTPGVMRFTTTFQMGRDYLYLMARSPAGRQYWSYYQASPIMSGWYMSIGTNADQEISQNLDYCAAFNAVVAKQPDCTFPYPATTALLELTWNPAAPDVSISLNGVLLQTTAGITSGYLGRTVNLQPGRNTMLITTYNANYTRDFILPSAGYVPFEVIVSASADTILSGSGLLLLSGHLAPGGETRTKATELTWSWSATPYLNLTDPLQIISTVNSARQLLLTQTNLAIPPGMYTFYGTAWDKAGNLDSGGARRSANASVTITVIAPVQPAAAQSSVTDLCTGENPCRNGGACSSELVVGATDGSAAKYVSLGGSTYALKCACATSSPQFFGADCSFAVLGCRHCVTQWSTPQALTVVGIGLSSTLQLDVAGVPATLQNIGTVTADDGQDIAAIIAAMEKRGLHYMELNALTFLAPALVNATNVTSSALSRMHKAAMPRFQDHSKFATLGNATDLPMDLDPATGQLIDAYVPMHILTVLPGAVSRIALKYQTLVFYTSSTCLLAGQWKPDGKGGCLLCPGQNGNSSENTEPDASLAFVAQTHFVLSTVLRSPRFLDGAFCPGAGRVWPLEGYYGFSEYTSPASCRAGSESCPGMDTSLSLGSTEGTEEYFLPGNEAKKCNDGYQGVKCSECAAGYYQQSIHCYICDATVDQSTQLTLIAITVAALLVFLSFCVALLSTEQLCTVIGYFLLLQQIATIGVSAAPNVPAHAQQVETFFTWMNLINFDLGLLRPGQIEHGDGDSVRS